MVERSKPPPHPLPRSRPQLPRRPTHTIRTAVACSTLVDCAPVLGRTTHECRSHSTCSARRRPSRFLVRTLRSRGPLSRSRYSPSAGVEPPGSLTHSRPARIRSMPVRLGTHVLSLHPPLRAQMSAARRECGRVELALRRRYVGYPAGGAAPRAKGLSGRLAR